MKRKLDEVSSMSIVSKIVAMRAIIRMQAIVAMFTAGRCFGDPKKCLDGEAEGGAGGEAGFNLVSYSECVWEMMITRSMMMMTKIMMMLKMMMMMMMVMMMMMLLTQAELDKRESQWAAAVDNLRLRSCEEQVGCKYKYKYNLRLGRCEMQG